MSRKHVAIAISVCKKCSGRNSGTLPKPNGTQNIPKRRFAPIHRGGAQKNGASWTKTRTAQSLLSLLVIEFQENFPLNEDNIISDWSASMSHGETNRLRPFLLSLLHGAGILAVFLAPCPNRGTYSVRLHGGRVASRVKMSNSKVLWHPQQLCLMSHFPRLTFSIKGPFRPGRSTPGAAARIFRTPPWPLELVRQDALASKLLQPCWEATVIDVDHFGADLVEKGHGNKTEQCERHVKGHKASKDAFNMPCMMFLAKARACAILQGKLQTSSNHSPWRAMLPWTCFPSKDSLGAKAMIIRPQWTFFRRKFLGFLGFHSGQAPWTFPKQTTKCEIPHPQSYPFYPGLFRLALLKIHPSFFPNSLLLISVLRPVESTLSPHSLPSFVFKLSWLR